MGKGHRHLKKLKSEKAKVKLKGSKHLPKGTNVTDTNFKIKQIVIPEQLKSSDSSEPLSRRKLNIKDLLSRLQHYNTTVKTDAITDLKEIVKLYPTEIVVPNLNQLIHGVSHLVLDKEKSVRQNSLRLIDLILSQVSVDHVTPFFDILSSYFRCAMTHIDTAIQEDSLLFLDILLAHVPYLVAEHSNKILDNFFDLISKLRNDSKPGRTLTLNLNSKLTTVKWRIKVLNRLHSILDAVIRDRQKNNQNTNQGDSNSVQHNPNQLYYPVYRRKLPPCSINLNDVKSKSLSQVEDNIVKNVDNLAPLLFETWLEVGPNAKEDSERDVTLTEESASVLNCILQILDLLHTFLQIYAKDTGNNEVVNNYYSKYKKAFSKHVISYFPYTKIISKKRKRNDKNKGVINSSYATTENLMICNLFCTFNRKISSEKRLIEVAEKIMNYIENIFTEYNSDNAEQNKQFLLLLQKLLSDMSKSWNCCKNEMLNILNSILELYTSNKHHGDFQNGLFNILCKLVSNNQFNKSPQFQIWLNTLPDLLCKKQINEKTLNMIALLAKQQNVSFTKELSNNFNTILRNLSTMKIIGAEDEITAKCKIISLIHYIPAENDSNFIDNIMNYELDTKLTKYLQEIVTLKTLL